MGLLWFVCLLFYVAVDLVFLLVWCDCAVMLVVGLWLDVFVVIYC